MNSKIVAVVVGIVALLVLGFFAGKLLTPKSGPPLSGAGIFQVTNGCYDVEGVTTCFVRRQCTTATSTIVAIKNPLSPATSTLTYFAIYGAQGATSTDIIVGTSTTPAPAGTAVATSSLVGNIMGMFNVTNGTQFNSVAGVTMGPGTGYRAPSAGTYPTSQSRVGIGPNEYVLVFSTSTSVTNNGAVAVGLLGLPSSCVVDAEFKKL